MTARNLAHRTLLGGGRVSTLIFSLLAASCSGSLEGGSGNGDPNNPLSGVPGTPGGTPGTTPGGTPGAAGTAGVAPLPGATDPDRVGIHRLNKAEYDNTVRDLLGVTTTPASGFISDEVLDGFDNIAAAFGMTEAQYEQYYNAADGLGEAVFADAALVARIMTCTPASAADTACIGQIVSSFGMRAWRRPLTDVEIARLTQVVTDAMAAGEDAAGGIKQLVKTVLSSVPFLYRIEMDADPNSATPHALNSYELASRLSYLGWSTMPDDEMFALAQSGALLSDATLLAEVDRMLASPKADQFVANFAGQWLGLRDMIGHQVDANIFPAWSEQLRAAMIQEGQLFFKEFLLGERQMTEFFTADVNFVDSSLGQLYGIPGGAGTAATEVSHTADTRLGFMGLASFLTATSFSYRTAPTLRGKWVLENLLCQEVLPPPADLDIPELDPVGADPAALQSENVRVRLEAHSTNPMCAGCHNMLDPIGMGLENFDAIGRYRTEYANGDAVDSSGQLPTGQQFSTLQELATILSSDPRLTNCVSERMLTYALGRQLTPTDDAHLATIRTNWATGGFGLRGLMKQIVLNDTFRFRRGEVAQ